MNQVCLPRLVRSRWLCRVLIAIAMSICVAGLPASDLHQAAISNIGIKECAACHSSPSPVYQLLGVTQFVRLVEAKEWLEKDKHAYAYELVRQDLTLGQLKSPSKRPNQLSVEITTKLRWKAGDGNFEQKCLTCHAGLSSKGSDEKIDVRFGVQCESCHGPGAEYARVENHQQSHWRAKTPQQKLEMGMRDLSVTSITNPVCISCHVGDIEQGRFITHAMYAAGHPVLPPFELQTFLNAMPPHWRTIAEKIQTPETTFEFQSEYLRAHYDQNNKSLPTQAAIQSSFQKTQRSMLGALSTSDAGIALIQQAAKEPNFWADYSLYNCMGCHQELKKNKGTRIGDQPSRSTRIPGRPFPADWLNIDASMAYRNNRQGSMETVSLNLEPSFNAVPFGDLSQIRKERDRHLDVLLQRLRIRERLERQLMTHADVKQWLRSLMEARIETLKDYWTAKQTAWLVCVAIDEMVEHQMLEATIVRPNQQELRELLGLELQLPQKQSVLGSQQNVLETANTFDADRCRKLISELVDAATANQLAGGR